MFIRQTVRKNSKNISVQIVGCYRDSNGRVRRKILRHMGSVPRGEPLEALMRSAHEEMHGLAKREQLPPASGNTAEKIMEIRKFKPENGRPSPADARFLKERRRFSLGVREVFGEMYEQLGFDGIWKAGRLTAAKYFRRATIMRLANRKSDGFERSRRLTRDGESEVPVEKFCAMADRLDDESVEKLKNIVANGMKELLERKIEVAFFDIETLFFRNFGEDEPRDEGRKEDGVRVALFLTSDGLPASYELFPENTSDAGALEFSVKKLRERFNLKKVIASTNATMVGSTHLETFERAGGDWVAEARIRNLDEESLERLRDYDDWTDIGENGKVGEIEIKGTRLVIWRCEKRARSDARGRENSLAKIEELISRGLKVGGRRGRFVRADAGEVSIDKKAVRLDKKLDGIRGVWTSLGDVPASEVYRHCGELRKAERSLRSMKRMMESKPECRWTEQRMRAHVATCFAAFSMLRTLLWKYNHHDFWEPVTEETAMEELERVGASLVVDLSTDRRYLIPSSPTRRQSLLYEVVGIHLAQRTFTIDLSSVL